MSFGDFNKSAPDDNTSKREQNRSVIIAEAQDSGHVISVFHFPVDSPCNLRYIPHF